MDYYGERLDYKIALSGMCEARPYTDGKSTMSAGGDNGADVRYVVVTSSATVARIYGCSLFIATDLPWFKSGESGYNIRLDDVFPVVMAPRLLLVRITMPLYTALCVVAHGPHQADKDLSARDFWTNAAKEVGRHRTGTDAVLLFTDANAQMDSEKLGDCEHAEHFLVFLQTTGIQNFTSVSNMETQPVRPLVTFTSATGSEV